MEPSTPVENVSETLPEGLREIPLGDKTLFILGTAHVSKQSVLDVQKSIEILQPDTLCVELCPSRMRAMREPQAWQQTDIFKVVREGKAFFLLAQLILTAFYRRMGDHLDVQPGAEMMEAIRLADEKGIQLVTADREVQITLKRVWGHLSFWQKGKLFYDLALSPFEVEQVEASMIEEMKQWDQLEGILDTFGKDLPGAKERLIDERDTYLSQKIRQAPGQKILAVVGAGHVPGICREVHQEKDLTPLETVPPPSLALKVLQWVIPVLVVILLIVGFIRGGAEASLAAIWIWFGVNGTLSALGTLLAFGHPLTIVTAFLAAPLTSLNPMIAAGWVAGLVQAWIQKPTVANFQTLPTDMNSLKGFWQNRVSRVLLVAVLANLGSFIGSLLATSWITARVLQ